MGVVKPSIADNVFTYRSSEADNDSRNNYQVATLKLALEKTIAEYGTYRLIPSPSMTNPRAVSIMKHDALPNFIVKLSYQFDQADNDLIYAPFPVDLGIVGYRICFTSVWLNDELNSISTLKELRKYTHGQGTGWSDSAILRFNGMSVVDIPNYESLFHMVAKRRFDLFCRGINELYAEHQSFKYIEDLTYNESFALSYDLPRFFYTNKNNVSAIERIQKGLVLAYQDGSLLALWKKHYQASVDFSKLQDRVIFRLHNPLLEGIDPRYKDYFINLEKGLRSKN